MIKEGKFDTLMSGTAAMTIGDDANPTGGLFSQIKAYGDGLVER